MKMRERSAGALVRTLALRLDSRKRSLVCDRLNSGKVIHIPKNGNTIHWQYHEMGILIELFNGNKFIKVNYFYSDMEAIHQAIRLNYTRISQSIQGELTFLSELSKITDDERFRQSITEVIYSLNDLSDTLDLQRRYLNPRSNGK